MERAILRCPSLLTGQILILVDLSFNWLNRFSMIQLVRRTALCSTCDMSVPRPRLLRLCVVLPCQRACANTDMASCANTEPSLNLLVTEIVIGKIGAKASRSLASNPSLLDPERRPFSLLVAQRAVCRHWQEFSCGALILLPPGVRPAIPTAQRLPGVA